MTTIRPDGLKDLPVVSGRIAEGGLRTKGYYKKTSSETPLVTVITVVLNRAHCFEKCIQSVLSQSYSNLEYIVIDGTSSDGTIDLLQKYNDFIDYWISEPDNGLYYAMNKAIDVATGDWLYFIGSDDVMLDCLISIVPKLKAEDAIYYGDVFGIGRKRIYNGPFTHYRVHVKGINHQGMFFPQKVFNLKRYDVTYRIAADYDLNLYCLIYGGYQFVYINELIALYNDVDGVSSKDRSVFGEFRSIIRKYRGFRGAYYTSRLLLTSLLETLHFKDPLHKLMSFFFTSENTQDRKNIARKLIEKGFGIEEAKNIAGTSHNFQK